MPTYNFDEVSIKATKTGKCGCGKRRTRTQKFYQTLNPFNRNKDGSPKNREEILIDLENEAASWKKLPMTCNACSSGRKVRV